MQPSAWYNNDPSAKPTLFKLLAADGFTIDTYGGRRLTLNIGIWQDFTWTFPIANMKIPILGALQTGSTYEPQDPVWQSHEHPRLRNTHMPHHHRNQRHNMP